jgi:hypothetical protein
MIPVILQRPNRPDTRVEIGECDERDDPEAIARHLGLGEGFIVGYIRRLKGHRVLLLICDGWRLVNEKGI